MNERWRLFVAVPIGEALRASLSAGVERWRDRPDLDGLRWTDPEAYHLTIIFLGGTESSTVPALVGRLEDVAARHRALRLTTGGLGGFPSTARSRVAWYGVADQDRSLRRLASDVRATLAPEDKTPFRPHLTLARARGEPLDLRPWLSSADAPIGELAVDEMRLMRSHVDRAPARYETVATIPIWATIHV